MFRMLSTTLLVILSYTAWGADAPVGQEVEVQLKSGDVIRGILLENTIEQVVVKATVIVKGSSIVSTRTIPAADVRIILTLAEEYALRSKNSSASGPEQASLARWCFEHGMTVEARRHAERALTIEPVNAEAQTMMRHLGLVKIDGTWTNIDELLQAKKLVRYDGTVTDAATRDRLKALMGKKLSDATALSEAQSKNTHLIGLLAAAKERITTTEKQATETTTAAADAEAKQKTIEGAKAADAAAAERVKNASTSLVTKHSDGTSSTTVNPDLANAEDAKRKTAAAVITAQRALAGANPATAKARKARLDQDLAKAREDVARLSKDQPLAQQAIPARQAAADASAKAYAEARSAVIAPTDLPPAIAAFLANEKR